MKKGINKRIPALQINSKGKLEFGLWAKSDEIKILKNCPNEKCSAEVCEMSSVIILLTKSARID